MWDLTTALALLSKDEPQQKINGGPDTNELLRLLDQCEISNSSCTTPCMSPCLSAMGNGSGMASSIARMKASNIALLNREPAMAMAVQAVQPPAQVQPALPEAVAPAAAIPMADDNNE